MQAAKNSHGERRSNATHQSTTDPESLLARQGKGKEAHLCYSGHILMENRNGLCMDARVGRADGRVELRSARRMIRHQKRRHSICPDSLGMDAALRRPRLLVELGQLGIRAHVPAPPVHWRAPDSGTLARDKAHRRMRTKGEQISQRLWKRVEEIFGWFRTVGSFARARLVGRWKIAQEMLMTGTANSLLRLARLEAAR